MPNSEIPKFPFPAWGATSKFIRANDLGPACCVFPVERNNDFAVNEPPKEKAQDLKTLSMPVFQISTNEHNYTGDVLPDVGAPVKLLVGPTYIGGDGKNGYVYQKPLSEKMPTFNAPILIASIEGVTASNHYNPGPDERPPKIESEGVMSYPMLPVEHGSKYTTQDFGCSGSGLKLDRQKVLAAPGNRDTGDRNAALIESKSKYFPEVSKKEAPPPMHGPKYPNIESAHAYGPVPARIAPAEARMEMPGPVYPGVEGNNEYCNIEERVPGEILFTGPKFPGVVEQNSYVPVEVGAPPKMSGDLVVAGPVFPVDHGSKYLPDTKRIDGDLHLAGPCFQVDHGSKYCPKIEKAPCEGERLMTTPIFPGIEAANKYGPTEPPLAPTEKIIKSVPMSTPKYPNVEAKNKYNLEELDNGFPEHAKPGGEPIMTGPKYPGVEESHKYGPVTERKETHKEICVPCYTEDHTNQYSHVPQRVDGELNSSWPVYRGTEAKNAYEPVKVGAPEKMTGQHVLATPVYEGVEHDCKFIPESKRVESVPFFGGPVLQVDHGSLHCPNPEKAPIEGQRLMTAPIFPGIEAQNCYGTALYT